MRIELGQVAAAGLAMEHRHDLHGGLFLGDVGIAGTGVTDDADVLVKIDGVHLAQLTAACNGLEDGHCHCHLDIAFHGTRHALLDKHGERRDQHAVQHACLALGKAVVVGSNEGNFFILDPLLERHDILGHVPDLFHRAAAFDVEGVQDIFCLGADGGFVGDIVRDRPHLFPVELFGVQPHTVVEVGLVDVQVHHAGVRTTDLCQIGVTEAAAHLCGTAPVLDLGLYLRVTALDHAGNDGVTLAGALQICHHLTHGAAGVQFAQPGGSIGVGIVRGFLLLDIHQHHRHIQIANSGQHIIAGGVGEQLQNDQINVRGAELVACGVLLLKFGHEGRELGQIRTQCDGKHANTGFGFNEHG